MLGTRRAFAAVVLAIGLFGAACGGTDFARRAPVPEPHPVARPVADAVVRSPALQAELLRAVSRTAAARTARTSISVTLTGRGASGAVVGAFDVAGTGVVDAKTGDARLELSVPLLDRIGGGGPIEQRIVGGVVYTTMPARVLRAGGVPAPVRWLSLDPRHVSASQPAALSQSQSQADPAGQLGFLAAISDDVRRIGPEAVRGVPATHYAATIDLGAAARGTPPGVAAARKLAQLGAFAGTRRPAVDVWLDADGRARRVVVAVAMSSGQTMRIQGDFYAFGAPLRVAAPPQSEVRPYGSFRIRTPAG
ncbi:MAG TPA: hypothetical protein VGP92_10260 [Acidimicrobiia bacterium]|nr:hypothetical protein [Acidimicrobiia bacterium]